MDTTTNLETAINGLIGLRKEEKTLSFKRVENLFYRYLKEFNYTSFHKDLLKSFFSNETNKRTQQQTIKRLLNGLMEKNRVSPITQTRLSKPYLRKVDLVSFDQNSYAVLMAKNGYTHINFFNWVFNKAKKIPEKKLIKKLKIGDSINFDFDVSELVATKSRSNQRGCITNSPKSLIFTQSKNKRIVYRVI